MAHSKSYDAVFFDLGGTLVEPHFGPQGRFSGFTELANARQALQALADKCPLGIISNTGDVPPEAVRKALLDLQLLEMFDRQLVLLSGEIHLDKSTTRIFELAAERAGAAANPSRCMFVGDDATERRTARRAGFNTRKSPDTASRAVRGTAKPVPGPNLSNLADPLEHAPLPARLDHATPRLPPL